MVAEKKSLHFWGQIATKVTKHVAEPILAPESRFRGIPWSNLHHFSRSIRSDRSRGSGEGSEMEISPWCLKCQLLQREQNRHGHMAHWCQVVFVICNSGMGDREGFKAAVKDQGSVDAVR